MTVVRHQRRTPLIRLLARLGWQRDPELWSVRCHDQQGRRARLLLRVTSAGVAIESTSPALLVLSPLEVGRLRAALRDALLSFARLAGCEPVGVFARTRHEVPPLPQTSPPVPRRRIHLDRLVRPSVAEIAARLAAPATSDVEDDRAQCTRPEPNIA